MGAVVATAKREMTGEGEGEDGGCEEGDGTAAGPKKRAKSFAGRLPPKTEQKRKFFHALQDAYQNHVNKCKVTTADANTYWDYMHLRVDEKDSGEELIKWAIRFGKIARFLRKKPTSASSSLVAPPSQEAADPESKPLANNSASSEGSGVRGNASPEKQTEQKEKHEDKQDQNNSEQEKKTIVEEDN